MKNIAFLFLFIFIKTITAQDTLILQPGPEGKDAYLDSYYTWNYGDYPNSFAVSGTHSGESFTSRTIFEFDLDAILPGAMILSAKFSLYFANNPSNPYNHYGDNQAYLQRVIEPWDEYGVTWYNQPQTTTENQVFLNASTYETQDYTEIDISQLIQDIVDNPDSSHGILLRLIYEDGYRRLMFASGDYEIPSKRPKLEIVYIECTSPYAGFTYSTELLKVDFYNNSICADEYFWDFGDGYFSNLENPWHEYDNPGDYQVCLYTSSETGSDTLCELVYLSGVFIDETGIDPFLAYPNPARGELLITTGFSGYCNMSLSDLSGKTIWMKGIEFIPGKIEKIELLDYSPGMYLLRIESGKIQAFKKIIISR